MAAIESAVTVLALSAVAGLLAAYRNTVILGAAIISFSFAGIGLIVGSALTTGWWQAFQLAIGVSLLVVGTVELGILGLLRHVLGEDESGRKGQSGKRQAAISSGDLTVTFSADGLNDSRVAGVIKAFTGLDESELSAVMGPSKERIATASADEQHSSQPGS